MGTERDVYRVSPRIPCYRGAESHSRCVKRVSNKRFLFNKAPNKAKVNHVVISIVVLTYSLLLFSEIGTCLFVCMSVCMHVCLSVGLCVCMYMLQNYLWCPNDPHG